MRTPIISKVAYESWDTKFVFVAVPTERGKYVRTDVCVVEVDCLYCLGAIGEPCRSVSNPGALLGKYVASTHWVRRRAFADLRKERRMNDRSERAARSETAVVERPYVADEWANGVDVPVVRR